MKIAIVDDDKKQLALLKSYVEHYAQEREKEITTQLFTSGLEFIGDYKRAADIILLDIDMPGIDGIETARKIRKVDSYAAIIFITNMAQYAILGYEVDALDFMVKPVSYFDLKLKIDKAIGRMREVRTFAVVSDGRTCVLSEEDVLYIEGSNQYVVYHTATGCYKVHATLKATEEKVGKGFCRCNNSYIVNLSHVTAIVENDCVVGKERLPVSRAKKKEFLDRLNRHLGGIV